VELEKEYEKINEEFGLILRKNSEILCEEFDQKNCSNEEKHEIEETLIKNQKVNPFFKARK
jgi:hypothetical protein